MKNTTHQAMRDHQRATSKLLDAIAQEFPIDCPVLVQLIPGRNTACTVIGHGEQCRTGRTISAPDHLRVRNDNDGTEHSVWINRVKAVTESEDAA